jgi:hypothetical protein
MIQNILLSSGCAGFGVGEACWPSETLEPRVQRATNKTGPRESMRSSVHEKYQRQRANRGASFLVESRRVVRAANTAANCHIPGEGCDTLPTGCRICRPVATAALSHSGPRLGAIPLVCCDRKRLPGEDASGPEANVQQQSVIASVRISTQDSVSLAKEEQADCKAERISCEHYF